VSRLPLLIAAAFLALVPSAILWRPGATAAYADMCLVMLNDTSGSLDELEFRQMREGIAGALADPALAYSLGHSNTWVLIAGFNDIATVTVDWFQANEDSLKAAAATVLEMRRGPGSGTTATGRAMQFGAKQFERAPQPCISRVIDIATDGENTMLPAPATVREEIDPEIQINGLVVGRPDQVVWFVDNVQAGMAAFSLHIESYEQFGQAMQRKLSQELY
jgi:hypothetical protein